MKKILSFILTAAMTFALVGCGGNTDSPSTDAPKYTSAVEVLTTVVESSAEENRFPISGGNMDNMVMDAPGAFDVSKTDELTSVLCLPESELSKVDDAASMVHMMNANTFTGAAYHLVDGTDMNTFAEAVKESVLKQQWICGMPDTLVVIHAGGQYVITAFGADEVVESFKTTALAALKGSEVILETPVTENF